MPRPTPKSSPVRRAVAPLWRLLRVWWFRRLRWTARDYLQAGLVAAGAALVAGSALPIPAVVSLSVGASAAWLWERARHHARRPLAVFPLAPVAGARS